VLIEVEDKPKPEVREDRPRVEQRKPFLKKPVQEETENEDLRLEE
jgi:hypothetical protein